MNIAKIKDSVPIFSYKCFIQKSRNKYVAIVFDSMCMGLVGLKFH